MKKIILTVLLAILIAGLASSQTITVHVSGTVTRDSTGIPINDHQVIIQADSNAYGFSFYATRMTNANGFYDCTINDVPATGAVVIFAVQTKNCDSSIMVQTFEGTTNPVTVNFVICNNSNSCEASFTSEPDSTHSGLIYFFDTSAPSGQITSWGWAFGDPLSGANNLSTLQNPSHYFAAPGTYIVCLTIATSTGCTSNKCQEIHIESQTTCHALYHYYVDSTNLLNLHFFDASTPANMIVSRYWEFGDGATATTYDPWHLYAEAGVYNVCLTIVTSDSCTSTKCDEIHVGENPYNCESWFTYSSSFLTVHFEGHTNSPYTTTYTWHLGDSAATTMTGVDPTFTYPAAGEYTVTLFTRDSTGCESTSSQEIHLYTTCVLYGHVTAGNALIDHGLVELLKVEGGAITVVDSKEVGDSAAMYEFEGVNQGHYYLRASLLQSSTLYGQFVPTYYISAINWTNANLVELGEPQNPYIIEMVHALMYGAGSGTISGTISQNTKMNDGGTPSASVEVLLLDTSGQPLAYTTTDHNGQFEFANMAFGTYMIYPEMEGKYTTATSVTLDGTHPSATTSFTIQGTSILGIQDLQPNYASGISDVYPNPSSDKAHVTVTTPQPTEITLSVYFITGQLADEYSFVLNRGANQLAIPVKNLNQGLYYISIKDKQGISVIRRMIIRR